jgi:tetratricopeptide (TPR) repeat protein
VRIGVVNMPGDPTHGPLHPSQRRWLVVALIGVAVLGVVGAFQWPNAAKMWRAQVQKDWYSRARSNESQGNTAEAARDYRRAEEVGLATPEFYTSWACFDMQKALALGAEEHFNRALSLDAGYGPARAGLAQLYMRRGMPAQAAAQYSLAATLMPDSAAQFYTMAGSLYEDLKSHDRALQMYRNALDARRGYLPALEGLQRLGASLPGK